MSTTGSTTSERQISTSVLVIGTGGSGLRAAIELAERASTCSPSASGPRPTPTPRSPPAASTPRSATMDPEDTWQQHAADTLKESYLLANPRTVRDRHRGRGPRHRGPRALRHAVRPRGRRPDLAALLRRAHLPPHRVRRRLHRPRDPAHARQPRRAAADPDPRHGLHHAAPRPRQRRLRRLRLRPERRHALRHPRRRGHPRGRRPHPHLAAHLVAPRREHRRLVPPRRRGGRPASATPSSCSSTPPGSSSPRTRPAPSSPRRRAARAASSRNGLGERFMARYDPERMELSTRDRVALACYTEIKEGRGTPERRRLARRLAPAARDDHDAPAARLPDAARAADARHHRRRRSRSRRPRTTRWAASGCAPRTTAPTSRGSTPSARRPAACTAPTASAATRSSSCWSSAASSARPPPRTRRGSTPSSAPRPRVAEARAEIDELLAADGPENVRALQRAIRNTMTEHAGVVRDEAGLLAGLAELDAIEARIARRRRAPRHRRLPGPRARLRPEVGRAGRSGHARGGARAAGDPRLPQPLRLPRDGCRAAGQPRLVALDGRHARGDPGRSRTRSRR